MEWSDIQHFRPEEFSSPDKPGSGQDMNIELVAKLDRMRRVCGFPFIIASGIRTAAHNKEVGGVDSSAHLTGDAADIVCRTASQRSRIIEAAIAEGIHRIGVAATFVHVDISVTLPQHVMWIY